MLISLTNFYYEVIHILIERNQAIYKTRFICLYITEKMGEEKIAVGIEPAEVKK